MDMLLVLLKLSVVALIVAIGMGSTWRDLTYLWRRPSLLLRSLVAMYVLVPLAAFLLVKTLPLRGGVKAALLVLAASAGAPLLPRNLRNFGSEAYVFSLVVTSSLLAIVLVPTSIALLARYLDLATEFEFATAARVIARAFLGPLAIGMVLRAAFPAFAERLADRLLAIAGVGLLAGALALVITQWQAFRAASGAGFGALALLMIIALAIGHLFGGPNPDERTALAIACATRHIGIAVLVATAFPGPRTAALIAGYIVTAAAVSIPYLRWRRRHSAR